MIVLTGDPTDVHARARLLAPASCHLSVSLHLHLLAEGAAPSGTLPQHSPSLEEWSVTTKPLPCLRGIVARDPRFPDGPVTTAPIAVVAPIDGWVRTFTGFYSLGRGSFALDRIVDGGGLGHD